jgi:hypothetical protein
MTFWKTVGAVLMAQVITTSVVALLYIGMFAIIALNVKP